MVQRLAFILFIFIENHFGHYGIMIFTRHQHVIEHKRQICNWFRKNIGNRKIASVCVRFKIRKARISYFAYGCRVRFVFNTFIYCIRINVEMRRFHSRVCTQTVRNKSVLINIILYFIIVRTVCLSCTRLNYIIFFKTLKK